MDYPRRDYPAKGYQVRSNNLRIVGAAIFASVACGVQLCLPVFMIFQGNAAEATANRPSVGFELTSPLTKAHHPTSFQS